MPAQPEAKIRAEITTNLRMMLPHADVMSISAHRKLPRQLRDLFDILVFIPGRCLLWIECKQPGASPREGQQARLDGVNDICPHVRGVIATSWEDVEAVLRELEVIY